MGEPELANFGINFASTRNQQGSSFMLTRHLCKWNHFLNKKCVKQINVKNPAGLACSHEKLWAEGLAGDAEHFIIGSRSNFQQRLLGQLLILQEELGLAETVVEKTTAAI